MTVCIAALYDNGKGYVLASDQMTTAHFPIGYEFESDEVEKIIKIDSPPVYVLISGDVVFANEVIENARGQIRNDGITNTAGIAERIRQAYQKVRITHFAHNELESRGLSLDIYYKMHKNLLPQLIQVIDNTLREYNPKVEFIVAGKDESSCHIFSVMNPGNLSCFDCLGFAAIGSGAPHAIYSIIEAHYKKSLDKEAVEKIVSKAKERSEVAPGVGKGTNMISEGIEDVQPK